MRLEGLGAVLLSNVGSDARHGAHSLDELGNGGQVAEKIRVEVEEVLEINEQGIVDIGELVADEDALVAVFLQKALIALDMDGQSLANEGEHELLALLGITDIRRGIGEGSPQVVETLLVLIGERGKLGIRGDEAELRGDEALDSVRLGNLEGCVFRVA